jgi:adenosylhomocysteine nucleosidase
MTNRPVLVMCAISQEAALLRSEIEDAASEWMGRLRVTTGSLRGVDVVLAEAGIGKVNAAVVATRLIDRFGPRTVLFTGVAGGLDPALDVGDVVIGAWSIQHDAGVFQDDRLKVYQAGHVPFLNPVDRLGYRPSSDLLETARHAVGDVVLDSMDAMPGVGRQPRVVVGTILTGDQFVASESLRERLHRELGGQAVEMEGAAIAQTAELLGVDCLVIRSLSDLAGSESNLDFSRFLSIVATNSARMVTAILDTLR